MRARRRGLISLAHDEVEHVLGLLVEDVRAGAESQQSLTGLIERLAEEPTALLGQNPTLRSELEKLGALEGAKKILAAYRLRDQCRHTQGKGSVQHKSRLPDGKPSRRANSEYYERLSLEFAAANLLVRLYVFQNISEWAVVHERLQLERAMHAFISARDTLLAQHGKKFMDAPKRERWDVFSRLMAAAYQDLLRRNQEPTARKLWWHLPKVDPGRTILVEDPTDDKLTYLKKGELEDIDFEAFDKRYRRLLDKLRSNKSLPPLID